MSRYCSLINSNLSGLNRVAELNKLFATQKWLRMLYSKIHPISMGVWPSDVPRVFHARGKVKNLRPPPLKMWYKQ